MKHACRLPPLVTWIWDGDAIGDVYEKNTMRKQGRYGVATHFLARNGQLLHLFGNPGMDLVGAS